MNSCHFATIWRGTDADIQGASVVDDEEEVMDTIEHRISWNEMGFEVIGKARNGVKALEISEKMQPDVVITDIKMPYMDGLELARNLKQDNPDVRILILTGFDEFEYARGGGSP